MNLKVLFIVHAVVTLAAGLVLVTYPGLIPSVVNIKSSRETYLICYLLAGCEIAFALLSWGAQAITDFKSLRLIAGTFIVLHLSSATLEFYAYLNGLSPKILLNVLLRIIVSFFFCRYGIFRISKSHLKNTDI